MDEIIKILLVMLISGVKFLAGPPIVYYGDLSEYSFWEANLYCIAGGSAGVLFFMYLSRNIINSFSLTGKNNRKRKRIFSKRNRTIVKFSRTYGLAGIALITPVILSIPIGTFIASRYNSNKKKIFLYMFCSIVLWSLILTSLLEISRIISLDDIRK